MNRSILRRSLLTAGCVLLTATVNAQEFVVSGDAAARMLDSTSINLATAERITQICERLATERGVAISVYVLDNDGNHVYIHRMDGQVWTNTGGPVLDLNRGCHGLGGHVDLIHKALLGFILAQCSLSSETRSLCGGSNDTIRDGRRVVCQDGQSGGVPSRNSTYQT